MIFPLLSTATDSADSTLPMYREIDWDFNADRPIWRGGAPVYVSGHRAVLVWCWNALHARRGLCDLFTQDYGTDLSALIGRPYTAAVRESEAIRAVREALMINPYVKAVEQISVQFAGSTLTVRVSVSTIYQEEATPIERSISL